MAMTAQTALYNRAIHADGWKPDRDYWFNFGTNVAITSIKQLLGNATSYTIDPEAAIWESLLTREIIIQGGL